MASSDIIYEVSSNKVVLIFAGGESIAKAAALEEKVAPRNLGVSQGGTRGVAWERIDRIVGCVLSGVDTSGAREQWRLGSGSGLPGREAHIDGGLQLRR